MIGEALRNGLPRGTTPAHQQCRCSRMDIASNHPSKRLIQDWCTSNSYVHRSAGAGPGEVVVREISSTNEAKRLPVMQILREVTTRGPNSYNNVKKLRSLAKNLDHGLQNRVVLEEAGAIPVLANFIFFPDSLGMDVNTCEEALGALILLPLQDIGKLVHIGTKQLTTISWLLNRGSKDGRLNAALLLNSLTHEDDEMKASVGNTAGIFEGLVQLLKEELYLKSVDDGLKAIVSVISNGPDRNVIRVVAAGVVFPLVDPLLETERRSQVQTLTKLMELLCSSPEGREAVIAHALAVPLLVGIINDVDSLIASENAVSCSWAMCQRSPTKCVKEAAGQVRILLQLSHLVESGDHQINPRTKQRAVQLLRQLRHSLRNCTSRF